MRCANRVGAARWAKRTRTTSPKQWRRRANALLVADCERELLAGLGD